MATDKNGKPVNFGDYLMMEAVTLGTPAITFTGIVRVVKLSESPKGTSATGAFVDPVGNGRVTKAPIDVAKGRLIMRSNGDEVK